MFKYELNPFTNNEVIDNVKVLRQNNKQQFKTQGYKMPKYHI